MKKTKVAVMALCGILMVSQVAFAKANIKPIRPKSIRTEIPRSLKGVKAIPQSFRVEKTEFTTIALDNVTHLVSAVVFNRNIDASTVQENVNFRLLKQIEQNGQFFWVDASTKNNTMRVRPNFITWVSGAPIEAGIYKMHLRGTIKSSDGDFLDCDKDGTPEGGNLPAYESQLYQSTIVELEEMDGRTIEDIEALFGNL